MTTNRLTGITWNTHAGAGIRNGGLEKLFALDPDFLLLQELRSRDDVLRAAPPSEWTLVARRTSGDKTGILARTSRLSLLGGSSRLISEGPPLGMHPARYRNQARYLDEATGREVSLHNVHTWFVPDFKSPNPFREGHADQILRPAAAGQRRRRQSVVIVGGDFNQQLDKPLPPSARHIEAKRILSDAGFRSAAELIAQPLAATADGSAVDELFVRPTEFVEVTRRHLVKVDVPGADHRAVLIELSVTSA